MSDRISNDYPKTLASKAEGDSFGEGAHGNVPELSVSDLSMALKRTVEQAFDRVRVRGEISGFKRAASGHIYLALKDADAVMDGVIWRGRASSLRFQPEDGLEVIATGKLTTYPGRSKYQIVIEHMEPAGIGALMALLEQRKKVLAEEGLFDSDRKRALPFLPKTIGVITSPTGAVIRDILHRLSDRCPRHVLVWPAVVQGNGAAEQVAGAISGFNAMGANGDIPRPDVIIVARGGGSLEDLWAFNEEVVVRAAACSQIPLISAVGHETDTTLIDYASDKRAPTPTAAIEFCVPVLSDLLCALEDLNPRLLGAAARIIQDCRIRLDGLARGLRGPADILALKTQRFDDLVERLFRASKSLSEHKRAHLAAVGAGLRPHMLDQDLQNRAVRMDHISRRLECAVRDRVKADHQALLLQTRVLESVGYTSVLKRGYAVVRDRQGVPVATANIIKTGRPYTVEFADGVQLMTAAPARSDAPKPSTPIAKKQSTARQDQTPKDLGVNQGSLFE